MPTFEEKENCIAETQEHIARVRRLITNCNAHLICRGHEHDQSKLKPPELDIFAEVTPKLKGMTYGSEEYKASLAAMKPALDHHYANNSHHPEYYPNGIDGMDLLDLLEMVCDWKAASERHADGDIWRSLEINKERFKISDQLQSILENTVRRVIETAC